MQQSSLLYPLLVPDSSKQVINEIRSYDIEFSVFFLYLRVLAQRRANGLVIGTESEVFRQDVCEYIQRLVAVMGNVMVPCCKGTPNASVQEIASTIAFDFGTLRVPTVKEETVIHNYAVRRNSPVKWVNVSDPANLGPFLYGIRRPTFFYTNRWKWCPVFSENTLLRRAATLMISPSQNDNIKYFKSLKYLMAETRLLHYALRLSQSNSVKNSGFSFITGAPAGFMGCCGSPDVYAAKPYGLPCTVYPRMGRWKGGRKYKLVCVMPGKGNLEVLLDPLTFKPVAKTRYKKLAPLRQYPGLSTPSVSLSCFEMYKKLLAELTGRLPLELCYEILQYSDIWYQVQMTTTYALLGKIPRSRMQQSGSTTIFKECTRELGFVIEQLGAQYPDRKRQRIR